MDAYHLQLRLWLQEERRPVLHEDKDTDLKEAAQVESFLCRVYSDIIHCTSFFFFFAETTC